MPRTISVALVALWALAAAAATVNVDEKAKTVSVSATFAKQGTYDVLKGAIEYLVTAKGGKEYETVFVVDCTAEELHQALLKIGLEPGEPAKEGDPPKGKGVRIFAEYEAGGKKVRRPADEFVVSKKTGKPLAPGPWVFTGSRAGYDPASDKEVLLAFVSKNLVGLHWQDSTPLLQNPRAESKEPNIYFPNTAELPKPGTPAVVIFERIVPRPAEGAKRVHVFVSGRVQGVGFRAWAAREARMLKLAGWVKNLPDGRVEAVVQGPPEQVDALVEKLKGGPRAARVEKLDVRDEPAEGGLEDFEIRY